MNANSSSNESNRLFWQHLGEAIGNQAEVCMRLASGSQLSVQLFVAHKGYPSVDGDTVLDIELRDTNLIRAALPFLAGKTECEAVYEKEICHRGSIFLSEDDVWCVKSDKNSSQPICVEDLLALVIYPPSS